MQEKKLNRFDLEQQIIRCWSVIDDIREVIEHLGNYHESNFKKETVNNTFDGLAQIYDIKFHKLWDCFDTVTMGQVKQIKELEEHIKMLNDECSALRKQVMEQCKGEK
jgi:regulator of replication initiation timing